MTAKCNFFTFFPLFVLNYTQLNCPKGLTNNILCTALGHEVDFYLFLLNFVLFQSEVVSLKDEDDDFQKFMNAKYVQVKC